MNWIEKCLYCHFKKKNLILIKKNKTSKLSSSLTSFHGKKYTNKSLAFFRYDSTGMFHWTPARAIEECIIVSVTSYSMMSDIKIMRSWNAQKCTRVSDRCFRLQDKKEAAMTVLNGHVVVSSKPSIQTCLRSFICKKYSFLKFWFYHFINQMTWGSERGATSFA